MIDSVETEPAECTAARTSFDEAHANLTKWNRPVLALGWATTFLCIFLLGAIGFILFFPDMASVVGTAVAAGGTLVSGGLFLFVVKARNHAQTQARQALKDVNTYCSIQQTEQAINLI